MKYTPPNGKSGRPVNPEKALRAWEKKYPDPGELKIVLRGMLYELRQKRTVRMRGSTQAVEYPQTIAALEEMLEAV